MPWRIHRTIALAILAVCLTGTPAFAETARLGDPVGDVKRFELHDMSDHGSTVKSRANGDIKRVIISYANGRIRFAATMREMLRRDVLQVSFSLRYYGNHQVNYLDAAITARDGNRQGVSRQSDPTLQGCDVQHRLNYRSNRASLSLSSDCIGTPRAIRAGVGVIVYPDARPRKVAHADLVPYSEEQGRQLFTSPVSSD